MIHSEQRWGFHLATVRAAEGLFGGKDGCVGQGAAEDLGRGTTSGGSEQRDDITMGGAILRKAWKTVRT
jgi:hypothetical protein